MNKKIPYGRQNITEEDIKAVVEVLRSDFLTQGPAILNFEKAFANYIGCKYAIAVNNGTAALHLSVMAMGIQPGDKVITTPLTFAASANAIRYCEGEVVFSDIDPESYLLDLNKLKKLLKNAPKGTYKGIIPVDFAGRSMNYEKLKEIANEYNLWIIEDACHSPGGFFIDDNGRRQNCGNGKFANLAIFSFHPVKHIAAGEGGMVTTNDQKLYEYLKNLRTHGIQQNPELNIYNDGIWYYELQELGYNYRLTDFQAALGLSQLNRANEGIERRTFIANRYFNHFKERSYIMGQSGLIEGHAYHLYIIEVKNRDELIVYLRQKNIFAQVHYIPLHLMPYYRKFGWKENDMIVAENYYKHCISIPIFPSLTDIEQDFVINSIEDFYNV